jgi:hypothetical protein
VTGQTLKTTIAALCLSAALAVPAFAETYGAEMREHPRIVKAIEAMEDAIAYMEKAPHDFGGHKARAIADTRAAIVQLREAIKFRMHQDNKH